MDQFRVLERTTTEEIAENPGASVTNAAAARSPSKRK